jgi:hypothetical protein
LEFEVRDHIYLRVSPMKGVKRFGMKGKLAPCGVGMGLGRLSVGLASMPAGAVSDVASGRIKPM